ncbi:hypothetical protein PHYSODRAFT_322475 [Phytophthora sojae]|uniref:Uncharacterized protein n=1 Tax=Phytophthora sojae (strain P6497) TaxID=1094619 RepID=G4YKL9_PHYSP|nr:hypothetical protein PHYSODRAFT_322475 [Phytophthora sojae]EGZ28851.1 hypothetical protein PHYSODRAFT_322475 [Phytophthora sojae]|eukprot:XP_009516126.1 hypothetical protein PHYSODRAFT_322475 [Phytophthora sojae]
MLHPNSRPCLHSAHGVINGTQLCIGRPFRAVDTLLNSGYTFVNNCPCDVANASPGFTLDLTILNCQSGDLRDQRGTRRLEILESVRAAGPGPDPGRATVWERRVDSGCCTCGTPEHDGGDVEYRYLVAFDLNWPEVRSTQSGPDLV